MIRNARYFVNHKTRYCQILNGPKSELDLMIENATRDGFVECSAEEQDKFSKETWAARDAGWNPNGRKSFKKFIEENSK